MISDPVANEWQIASVFIGVAVLLLLLWVNFGRPLSRRKHYRAKQRAIDELSDSLSNIIGDLLNRRVTSAAALGQWEHDYNAWCADVSERIGGVFTRTEQVHFDRLGLVPENLFGIRYNAHHNHLLNQLGLKIKRLREILRDNQQRD